MPVIDVTEDLRNVIKEERKKRGLRGDTLSKDIKKSASYVSQIENGSIKTIDISVLYKLFEEITALKDKDLFEYFRKVVNLDNIKLTEKDKQEKEWLINLEYQFRLFPITQEIIDFLNGKLNELKIIPKELVNIINQNEGLDDETKKKIKEVNTVWVQVSENGNIETAIQFNLEENFVEDIISKKIKSINKINLQGILYNLYKIECKDEVSVNFKVEQKLKEFKFFTLEERNEKIEKAQDENIDLDSVILHEDNQCNMYINKIRRSFVTLRDMNCGYGLDVFSNLDKSLSQNKNLTYAMLRLEYFKLKDLSDERKKEFIDEIKQLIDEYSKPKESDFIL